jgi:hypothetical protein
MEIEIKVKVLDLVTIRGTLIDLDRRLNDLINVKPENRVFYEFDKKKLHDSKKILADMILNC